MLASVSVVIPCYRQAHFLADAIESVLAQTHPAHEIVVVDDGSPDDVATVMEAYPDIHLITQENGGVSRARNRGLKECSGEYVVFLDSDDRLLPDAIRFGVEAHRRHPHCALVWGCYRAIDVDGNLKGSESRPYEGEPDYAHLLERNIVGAPVRVMFRSSSVVDAGGFLPMRNTEDYEFYLRLARRHEMHCHGKMVAEYRYHDDQMSADLERILEGMLKNLDLQTEFVGEDRVLLRALKAGRKDARLRYDGEARMERLRKFVRARRWGQATVCAAGLLVRYPRLLLVVVARRVKRAILPPRAW